MGRGVQSGIGIAAFQHGGFVVDGGQRMTRNGATAPTTAAQPPASGGTSVPPVLFHYPFPADWYFVVVMPETEKGFSGEKEQRAFESLPPAPPTLVEKMSRLLLVKMLPALVERDIVYFGQALTQIQRLVGDCFAAVQGSRYANALSERLIDFLLDTGAAGAGQSSWGPTVYALVDGERQALLLESKAQEFLARNGEGHTFCAQADNRGVRLR
jgi:beta-RFAP synthase